MLLFVYNQGLGLEYARRLATAGCKTLVLTGRTPALSAADLAGFANQGTTVYTVAADAGTHQSMHQELSSPAALGHEHLATINQFVHYDGIEGKCEGQR